MSTDSDCSSVVSCCDTVSTSSKCSSKYSKCSDSSSKSKYSINSKWSKAFNEKTLNQQQHTICTMIYYYIGLHGVPMTSVERFVPRDLGTM